MYVPIIPLLVLVACTLSGYGPAMAGSVGLEYLEQTKILKAPPKLTAPNPDKAKTEAIIRVEDYLFLDQDDYNFKVAPTFDLDLSTAGGDDEEDPRKAILPPAK